MCARARAPFFVGFASLCLVLFSPESGSASVGPSSSSGPIIFVRAASRRQFRHLACDLHASGCAWARRTACQCSVLDISLLSSHQPPTPTPSPQPPASHWEIKRRLISSGRTEVVSRPSPAVTAAFSQTANMKRCLFSAVGLRV